MAERFSKVRDLTDDETKALHTMRAEIDRHRRWNQRRSKLHDAKERLRLIGFSIPENMYDFQTPVGWAEKTITVPNSRVRPSGFTARSGVPSFTDELFETVSSDEHVAMERQWVHSAMLHGVAFAFVTFNSDADVEPRRYVKPATTATAVVDSQTGEVVSALESLGAASFQLYMPGVSVEVARVDGRWVAVDEDTELPDGLVPCEPLPWAPTTEHPMGRSRITRPLVGFMEQGVRTMLRQESNAEFYSAPQRALMGADEIHFTGPDGKKISPLQALIGSIWALPDVWDEDEQKNIRPELQQLQQATMQPHVDMLRSIASMVSSETTIPLTYLGVVHDQPASAEAILAAESDMVAMLNSELPNVGVARKRFAVKVAALQQWDYSLTLRRSLRSLRGRFMDPGTPTLAARADAAQKYVTTFPAGDPEVAMEIAGLDQDQIERNLAYAKRVSASDAVDSLVQSLTSVTTSGGDAAALDLGPDASDEQLKNAQTMKAQFDALGVAVRAGVDPVDAANKLGLNGVKFTGAVPVSLRIPESDASRLED